jgi:hypothetical protein
MNQRPTATISRHCPIASHEVMEDHGQACGCTVMSTGRDSEAMFRLNAYSVTAARLLYPYFIPGIHVLYFQFLHPFPSTQPNTAFHHAPPSVPKPQPPPLLVLYIHRLHEPPPTLHRHSLLRGLSHRPRLLCLRPRTTYKRPVASSFPHLHPGSILINPDSIQQHTSYALEPRLRNVAYPERHIYRAHCRH